MTALHWFISWLIAAWTLVVPTISLEIVSCGGLRRPAVIGRTQLNKPDRSGHQNIKTKIKSFFRIFVFFTCSRTAFSHIQIRTLYVTRFRTFALRILYDSGTVSGMLVWLTCHLTHSLLKLRCSESARFEYYFDIVLDCVRLLSEVPIFIFCTCVLHLYLATASAWSWVSLQRSISYRMSNSQTLARQMIVSLHSHSR